MHDYTNLGEFQKDVIRELGNIGAGNAATALGKLLNDRIEITVPALKFIEINEISGILGGPENEAAGIILRLSEDIDGLLVYLMDCDFINHLLGCLISEDAKDIRSISELGLSALKEVSNILSGSFVNVLCSFTGSKIRLSLPEIAIDMVGAILNFPASFAGEMSDQLLLVEVEFILSGDSVQSHLLLIPDIRSLNKIIERLGVG